MHSLYTFGLVPPLPASSLARCSGGIFANCSSGMGISPLICGFVVTSHSPGLMFGFVNSAACTRRGQASECHLE